MKRPKKPRAELLHEMRALKRADVSKAERRFQNFGYEIERLMAKEKIDTGILQHDFMCLASRSKHQRLRAIVTLGASKEKRATPALMQVARRDPKCEVQREALETLGMMGDKRAFPVLVEALERPLSHVRFGWEKVSKRFPREARQLEKVLFLSEQESGKLMGKLLVNKPFSKEIVQFLPDLTNHRISAARALGELKDKRALPILSKNLLTATFQVDDA